MSKSLFAINLSGVIREIREFVKDIFGRNKDDREKNRIQIINSKIDTLKQIGYTNEEIREMISNDIRLKNLR